MVCCIPRLRGGGQKAECQFEGAGRGTDDIDPFDVESLQLAHTRSMHLAESTALPSQVERLHQAVVATHNLAEYGSAEGTLDKDDHTWDYWDRFCGTRSSRTS